MPTRQEMIAALAAAHADEAPAASAPDKGPSREQMIKELAQAHTAEPDHIFGPGGKAAKFFNENPNLKSFTGGMLEQAPIMGSVAGGALGATAGAVEGVPTFGVASPVLAAAQGIAGAGLGAGAGKSVEQFGKHYLLGEEQTNEENLRGYAGAVGEGALFHNIGEVAGPVLKAAGKGAGVAGKKAVTTFLGPSREAIDTYLMRPEAIKGAKSVEGIKDEIDNVVGKLFENVQAAKLSKEEAKQALKDVESQISEASRDGTMQLRIKQADIKDQMRDAQAKLDSAFKLESEKLSSIKSPIHLADDVAAAQQDLKAKITDGSKRSYEILDQDNGAYGVRSAGKYLREVADGMNIQAFDKSAPGGSSLVAPGQWGAVKEAASQPVTQQTIGVQNELRSFAELLEQTPEKVPARELKKMLQQIDNSEKAMYGNPGFDSRVSEAYKMVRAKISDAIKAANPAYASEMEGVAKNAKLFDESLGRFSDPRATVSRLNSIASRTSQADQDLLARLGQATDRDFQTPVRQFTDAQATLKDANKMEAIRRGLPEYKNARLQEMAYRQGQRPEAAEKFVENFVSAKGLPAKRAAAEAGLSSAESGLAAQSEKLEPFKQLTPNSTQSRITSLMKTPGKESIETRRALEALGKTSNKDFVQWINDRRVADQFKGEYRNGSRNVVIFSALFGGTFGVPGATAGAAIGASIDRFGPQIAQKVLNGVIKANGVLSKDAIQAMNVPPAVRTFLSAHVLKQEGEAAKLAAISKSASNDLDKTSSTSSNENSEPLRGKAKWAREGIEKLSKHAGHDLQVDSDDPKVRELLIQASDLKVGSKAMDKIMSKIEREQK